MPTDYSPEIFIAGRISNPRVIKVPGVPSTFRAQNAFPTFFRGEDIPITISDPGVDEVLVLTVKGHDWNADALFRQNFIRSGAGDLTAIIPASQTQNWHDDLYFYDVFTIRNVSGQPFYVRWASGSFSVQNSVNSNDVCDLLGDTPVNTLVYLDLVNNETPNGDVDGINTTFTTVSAFLTGKLNVFLNGVRQRLNVDFTVLSNDSFQMTTAPLENDTITVDYVRST
jgi:hypothetical protein